ICSSINAVFNRQHPRFAESLNYVKFRPPPAGLADVGIESNDSHRLNKDVHDWMENIYAFEQNLRTLLSLPCHRYYLLFYDLILKRLFKNTLRFWSTVIHRKEFHEMLDSYLSYTPKFFNLHLIFLTDQIKETLSEIHKLVFRIFLRLSNYKESKKDRFTPEVFSQIIYENNVFDIPKLMEICSLYTNVNPPMNQMLAEMIERVFNCNKAYSEDLQSSVMTVISSFQRVQRDLGISIVAKKVPTSTLNLSKLKSQKWADLQDTVYFITDLSVTVSSFVSLFSTAAKLYHKHRVENEIVTFYENVFTPLHEELELRFNQDASAKLVCKDIRRQIALSKHHLIKAFREIMVISCINPLFDVRFSHDYFNKYPFVEDLSSLMEQSELTGFQNVDQTRIDYLLSATSSFIGESGELFEKKVTTKSEKSSINGDQWQKDFHTKNTNNNRNTDGELKPQQENHRTVLVTEDEVKPKVEKRSEMVKSIDQLYPDVFKKEYGFDSLSNDTVNATIESHITSVTDIFPDLGHGFIEICLEHYNYDVEMLVDALLTSSLPEKLDKLDRTMQRKPLDVKPNEQKQSEVMLLTEEGKLDKTSVQTSDTQKEVENVVNRENKESKLVKDITIPILKMVALRMEEESMMEREYEDEYDDTYDEDQKTFESGSALEFQFERAKERRNIYKNYDS
ncbi:hypothetical protein B4U79_05707, partial [Dinothrombium tinctorium]